MGPFPGQSNLIPVAKRGMRVCDLLLSRPHFWEQKWRSSTIYIKLKQGSVLHGGWRKSQVPFLLGLQVKTNLMECLGSHNKHIQLDQTCKSKGRCSMGREGVGHAEKLNEHPADAICLLRKRLLTSREGERAELSRPGLEGFPGFQEPARSPAARSQMHHRTSGKRLGILAVFALS